tara:strand:+ start:22 stop:888 length:867 start_codon:yes stop_codon:yes gene_type:complete
MFSEKHKKEMPLLGMSGMGGGVAGNLLPGVDPATLPFSASGGTKSGPTGGYYYHVFGTGSATFQIDAGVGPVEVAITGAGGAGSSGGPPSGDEAGAGGGGAGTGIFTIGELIPGTYPVTVGQGGSGAPYPPSYNSGSAGGSSSFSGPPDYPGSVSGPGGNGSYWANDTNPSPAGSGSWPASPSFTTNSSFGGGGGGNGDNRFPHPSRNYGPASGGHGGNAGHYNNPGWWTPFIGPGRGGWSPSPWPTGKSGYGNNAPDYGAGGGGSVKGGRGGTGSDGRVVIRYPDSI